MGARMKLEDYARVSGGTAIRRMVEQKGLVGPAGLVNIGQTREGHWRILLTTNRPEAMIPLKLMAMPLISAMKDVKYETADQALEAAKRIAEVLEDV